jgi:hypothetical protein
MQNIESVIDGPALPAHPSRHCIETRPVLSAVHVDRVLYIASGWDTLHPFATSQAGRLALCCRAANDRILTSHKLLYRSTVRRLVQ